MQQYEDICGFLGILTQMLEADGHPRQSIASDGFANAYTMQVLGWKSVCVFTKSPIPFIKRLVVMRMRGQSFDHTHMGWIASGKAIDADHFTAAKTRKTNTTSEIECSEKKE
jgi:hypothetical protein